MAFGGIGSAQEIPSVLRGRTPGKPIIGRPMPARPQPQVQPQPPVALPPRTTTGSSVSTVPSWMRDSIGSMIGQQAINPYAQNPYNQNPYNMKKGGKVKTKKYAKGGSVSSSASRRADGIAQKGKTRGRFV